MYLENFHFILLAYAIRLARLNELLSRNHNKMKIPYLRLFNTKRIGNYVFFTPLLPPQSRFFFQYRKIRGINLKSYIEKKSISATFLPHPIALISLYLSRDFPNALLKKVISSSSL